MARNPTKMQSSAKANRKNTYGLLQAAQFTIPYIKELKELDGVNSTHACLIMAQIEYWTFTMGETFYKFTTPPKSGRKGYSEGQSWTEGLGVTKGQFDRAFGEIGVHYGSMSDYLEASKNGDVFQGKFYCSYLHKPSHQTYYVRNKKEVEKAIKIIRKLAMESGEAAKSDLPNRDNEVSGDSNSGVAENAKSDVVYTDTTTDTTTDTYTERVQNSLRDSLQKQKERVDEEQEKEETIESGKSSESYNFELRPPISSNGEEKIAIRDDFSPTWDAKYRAVIQFPNKLASWATEKFIKYYKDKNLRLTSAEWQKKWWDWMQSERETFGNEKLSAEHREILNYVADEVLEATWHVPCVFDWEDVATYFDYAYSEMTLTDVMFQLYEADKLGGVGDLHYFNNIQREEWWSDIVSDIKEKGLEDEVIYIHSLPRKRVSLRRLREIAQERAAACVEETNN